MQVGTSLSEERHACSFINLVTPQHDRALDGGYVKLPTASCHAIMQERLDEATAHAEALQERLQRKESQCVAQAAHIDSMLGRSPGGGASSSSGNLPGDKTASGAAAAAGEGAAARAPSPAGASVQVTHLPLPSAEGPVLHFCLVPDPSVGIRPLPLGPPSALSSTKA